MSFFTRLKLTTYTEHSRAEVAALFEQAIDEMVLELLFAIELFGAEIAEFGDRVQVQERLTNAVMAACEKIESEFSDALGFDDDG